MEHDNQTIVETLLYNAALQDLEILRPVLHNIWYYLEAVTTNDDVEHQSVELIHRVKIWEILGGCSFLTS